MKIIFYIAVLLVLFTLSNCKTPKLTQEEKEENRKIKIEEKETASLLAEARKQHYNNQNKETRKVMQKSKKYNRKLNQPKRKKCF